MKSKFIFIVFFSFFLLLAFTACNDDFKNELTEEIIIEYRDFENKSITFPVSNKYKTEFNAKIYEIEPFNLTFDLPKEWSTKETILELDEERFIVGGIFSVVDIYNQDGHLVGYVGYNIYSEEEAEVGFPYAIYSQISLANHYRFDAREEYTIVKETDSFITAVTNVIISANFLKNSNADIDKLISEGKIIEGEYGYYTKGILSHNTKQHVYIAMEFENNALNEEQFNRVAKSIILN
ncbi:MAG: hypothetical protein FWG44_01760 [Oscillospiraceae bacterium]|nr:hypothetical protein [Oscillospiraceae bacterium]